MNGVVRNYCILVLLLLYIRAVIVAVIVEKAESSNETTQTTKLQYYRTHVQIAVDRHHLLWFRSCYLRSYK